MTRHQLCAAAFAASSLLACATGKPTAEPNLDLGQAGPIDFGVTDGGQNALPDLGVGPGDRVQICEVCRFDEQCGEAGSCLQFGEEFICLERCPGGEFLDCPRGFQCGQLRDVGGFYCLPTDGCCIDEDGDNYGVGSACAGPDCNDVGPPLMLDEDNAPIPGTGGPGASIQPGATDICNGVDDDCDEALDEEPTNCGTSLCENEAGATGGFVETPSQTCDSGACVGAVELSCALATCVNGGANGDECAPTCAPEGTDDELYCVEAAHCDNAVCFADLEDGLACDEDSDCISDNCANGVCACGAAGNVDVPDDAFADTNCDGLDGTLSDMIFVDAIGGSDDFGDGSREFPLATITKGITFAVGRNRTTVAVSQGTYRERVVMSGGVNVHGGYSAASDWARSASFITTIEQLATDVDGGRVEAVSFQGIGTRTVLDRFVILSGSAATAPPGAGTSVYGVRVNASNASATGGVQLRNLTVEAGRAANGTNGGNGSNGSNGARGSDGQSRGAGTVAPGGAGASSSCGSNARGGNGGIGERDTVAAACGGVHNGRTGAAPAGDATCGGGGGGASAGGCFNAGINASVGGTGRSNCGSAGATGAPGAAAQQAGRVSAGLWAPDNGSGNGGNGGSGTGGSGGGGGGSGDCTTVCRGGTGGGGGGGGAGGCGGRPGGGGTGGGGAFGLLIVDSDDVTVVNSSFVSGDGGNAGRGGNGGNGGNGGGGGSHGNGSNHSGGLWPIDPRGGARGGAGGTGRPGGRGGGGSGGGGGPSIAQFICRSTVSGTEPSAGTPGAPGTGGAGGAPNGSTGPAGISSPLTSLDTPNCAL